MEKMLVTQALNELKVLRNRINKEINDTKFVTYAKTSEKKVSPSQTKEEFEKEVLSSYQSINDLILRSEKIKSAVVASNAITEIELCGEKVTVAKAIDMKNTIILKEILLRQMKDDYAEATRWMNQKNQLMETKIDNLVETAFGKESKTSIKSDDYDSIAIPYRKANETSLVDPLKIKDEIDKLDKYIEEFKSTVDAKLQVSNCITYIEIE